MERGDETSKLESWVSTLFLRLSVFSMFNVFPQVIIICQNYLMEFTASKTHVYQQL